MADPCHHPQQQGYGFGAQQQKGGSHQALKAAAAVAAGGSMLLLSGLTLAGTVVALTVATPLLVIFSPVLVPAAIALSLVAGGLAASGGFGVAALSVLTWMYRYASGKRPAVGADAVEQARHRLALKAREAKEGGSERSEQAA